MKKRINLKLILPLILALSVFVYVKLNVGSFLNLESLKQNKENLHLMLNESPVGFSVSFGLIYVLVTALSIPGASVLTLAAGALFGLLKGTIIVSFASSIGATLAFLASRYLFKSAVEKNFKEKINFINEGIQKDGVFYLFTLRLIPAIPFFLINVLMGLTSIRAVIFYIVSQVGMLAGTLVYVNAGTELGKIDSLSGILSFKVLISFTLLGLLPLVSKRIVEYIKSKKYIMRYEKPWRFDYNMVVIGGGSAGLVSAYIASAVKAKVALIEKHKMGGDCLNTGCVPSKALIRSAKISNYLKRANEFGLEKSDLKVNFANVMGRIQKVVEKVAPHDSIERYTELGVECITGEAKILSPFEVQVNGRVLKTKNIVVATGARPFVPPIDGIENINYLTSDNVWNLRLSPERLVVLGGGPIGCELAQSFSRLGAKVTIIEMADRIMAKEDLDVSDLVTGIFKKENIGVLTSYKAKRFEIKSGRKYLICENNGKDIEIEFDEVLVALGRRANTKGFGLEDLGVEVSKQGTVIANEYLQTTNYPNIYVCGDVTGPYQFTHTASHQAWYVAVNALFSPFKKFKVDYRVIPWCTFTDPEVARVGLNEAEAKAKGLEFEVTKYQIDDLDRAIADSEDHGFIKVLTPPKSDKILGVTIVGHHAGDIISEYVTAMKYGLGLNKILGTIHIYPTLAESNKYVAGVWKRKNAPQFALKVLSKFHQWQRKEV